MAPAAMSLFGRRGSAARVSSLMQRRLLRGYGSAAAAQLDYDHYYNDDDVDVHEGKMCRGEMAESNGWETAGRGVQWVIMGDPMVKRHVYATRLANLLDVPHISMGSLVRQELNPSSPVHKQIASAINKGKLVPEDIIFGLLSKRLEEGYNRGETGFILDGIPRTRMQAEILDQIAEIDLVLNLKFTEESMSNKTSGNGICSPPRDIHSMATSGFNVSVQPQTGHFPTSSTNSGTMWQEKLRLYAEQRKHLQEYYRQQQKLLDFQVSSESGDPWQGLLAVLQLQHRNVVTSAAIASHKLTA